MRCPASGYVDFLGPPLVERNLAKEDLSWCIPDHYPLWAEFSLQD